MKYAVYAENCSPEHKDGEIISLHKRHDLALKASLKIQNVVDTGIMEVDDSTRIGQNVDDHNDSGSHV